MPFHFSRTALVALGLALAVGASQAQSDPKPSDIAAIKEKFALERESAVKSKYPASTLTRADELAARGEAALKDGDLKAAARHFRDARWQLPFLPQGLPENVVRVFGESRIRHVNRINALEYNADGTRLASCSKDGTVKIWDLGNGREVVTYRGHLDQTDDPTLNSTNVLAVAAIAFHPKQKAIASAAGNQVHLWDPETGKFIKKLFAMAKNEKPIKSIAFRPDGKFLAVGCDDGILRVVDAETGNVTYSSPPRSWRIEKLAYSPNGSTIVVGDNNSQISFYAPGQAVPVLMSVPGIEIGEVRDVAFTPDGGAVFACGHDPKIRLTAGPKPDAANPGNTSTRLREFIGHNGPVSALAVSPDGGLLISGGEDCTVRVWEVASGKQMRAFQGHQKVDRKHGVTAIAIRKDGKQVASGSDDGAMRLWDLNSVDDHRALTEATDSLWAVAYSPDGKRIATAGSDKVVRVYSTASFGLEAELKGAKTPITSLAFFPDSNRLVAGGGDRVAAIWDVSKSQLLRELKGSESAILGIAVDAEGKRIVTGSADRTVRAFSPDHDRLLWTWKARSAVCAVAIQKGGKRIAVGMADGTLAIVDVSGPVPKEEFSTTAHVSGIACLAFSGDGEKLASVGGDGILRIWGANDRGSLVSLVKFEGQAKPGATGGFSPLTGVAFAPDNRYVASVGADATVRIWDVETKSESRGFRGHTDWVSAVAFSPDGRYAASVGVEKDKCLRIFELPSLATSPTGGHLLAVNAVAVSPDGKFVATAGTDQTIKVWNILTGKEVGTLIGNADKPWAIAFLGNDSLAMGGSVPAQATGRLHIWGLHPIRKLASPVTGEVYAIVPNADGSKFAAWAARPVMGEAGVKNHRLEIYDAKGNVLSSALLNQSGRDTKAATFTSDLAWAISGDEKGNITILDVETKKRIGDEWPLFDSAFGDLGISPDKKYIVGVDDQGQVKIADVAKREVLGSATPHKAGVRTIVVSPTGTSFVTISNEREVKAWSLDPTKAKNLKAIRTWDLPVSANGACYTPDGKQIVTANSDGTAYLLELP